MFKIKKTRNFMFFGALTVAPILTSISCTNYSNEEWDDEIVIGYSSTNPNFFKNGTDKKFIKLLEEKFEQFRKNDPEANKFKPVKFKFADQGVKDKSIIISDLESNKNFDIAVVPYSTILDYLNGSYQEGHNFRPKKIAQSYTLGFVWQNNPTSFYIDGSKNDPLRLDAEAENNAQMVKYGEYKTWTNKKDEFDFDGSKYRIFYKKDKVIPIYRGAIIISGNDEVRKNIINAWENKNFDEFIKHGIVYKNHESGGKFKYQLALLARHFGKKIDDLKIIFSKNEHGYFVASKNLNWQLGKKNEFGKITNIIFTDEGEFNWTPKHEQWTNGHFTPSDPDAKVRVLTMTNPAPYDIMLGKTSLSSKQAELIAKAISSLSVEENLYGTYTGYNKFKPIDENLFVQMLKLQTAAVDRDTNLDETIWEKLKVN
ncbi:ABC transporter thiamine pyrophosphate-binding lipoprotein p37/Cypl [Mycoplasma tauri]|uniref:ABC transporter thiamine pyrophosphate-binding lipoprotein p37/Cypl n=1 Tax=Mycoplasma tauri TaxID=547987 RepID=UPI0019674A76|nr:ABC transporter substrate-binding protein [Mycoplasma tauri]MBZ4203690.1 ABC transporter substrate-binding protein [Mycoplasma tauri]MBZ4226817.1 ABC transporter substrate-binding protein [Mycoplasma tauri]QSB07247.1 ABC transporter substrate-binding protein [Mycoplasma tauri]